MWQWEAFAPAEPSAMGRLFGGAGRYERAVADAQRRYGKALAERAAAERERLGRLVAAEQAYAQRRAAEQEAVDRHNAEVDRLKQRLDAGDPDAVVECFRRVLRRSAYPDGFPRSYRVAYQAEARQLVVEYQLPGREIIPTQARFNYNKSLDLVEAKPRAPKEIAKLYESVVSQIALRTLREVFAVQADGVVDMVVFNGHVSTKDPATGQPRYPCIVSVAATREQFSGLVLTDVTPREPLRHLNVLVSPHPFDLEAVRPVLEFDLTKYKFVDEIDMIAGLDRRLDLLELTPTEFEHLVRQLFEEIGMQAWVTQASRDDGVDAVAINPDPIVGGLCIVQAKRYTGVVSTESVRALGGVMDDKRAAKGLMVTTSWYGKESWEFAARHGRIELIDGPRLKHLLKERVGLDVLISLPRRAAKTT
jgi:restriction system protein